MIVIIVEALSFPSMLRSKRTSTTEQGSDRVASQSTPSFCFTFTKPFAITLRTDTRESSSLLGTIPRRSLLLRLFESISQPASLGSSSFRICSSRIGSCDSISTLCDSSTSIKTENFCVSNVPCPSSGRPCAILSQSSSEGGEYFKKGSCSVGAFEGASDGELDKGSAGLSLVSGSTDGAASEGVPPIPK